MVRGSENVRLCATEGCVFACTCTGGGEGEAMGIADEAEPSLLSRTDGSSGGGPSLAHFPASYFDLINDSILLLYVQQRLSSNGDWYNSLIRRNVARSQVGLPVEVRSMISPFHD